MQKVKLYTYSYDENKSNLMRLKEIRDLMEEEIRDNWEIQSMVSPSDGYILVVYEKEN